MRPTPALVLLLASTTAQAGPLVGPGLEALVTFEEGAGAQAADATGHGHAVVVSGTAGWTAGAAVVRDDASLLRMDSKPVLRGPSFTYDFWTEVTSSPGDGRFLTQCGKVGDPGPDLLERSGVVAVRITDRNNATFDVPTVGTRSNAGGADHYGKCSEAFHRGNGPEHLVLTHDGAKRLVRLFIGLAGKPIKLCFEATYSGKYVVGGEALTLGNMADGSRGLPSRHYQLAYYTRPLEFTADGQQVVVGGEVLANHQAGPSASLPLPPDMSAPRDLASPPDAATPADLARPPDAAAPADAAVAVPVDAAVPIDADRTGDGLPAAEDARPSTPDLVPNSADPRDLRTFRDLGPQWPIEGGCACSTGRGGGRTPVGPALALLGALIALALRRRTR